MLRGGYLEAERDDDDFAGVVGVADGVAGSEAQALFPFSKTLVILIWKGRVVSNLNLSRANDDSEYDKHNDSEEDRHNITQRGFSPDAQPM